MMAIKFNKFERIAGVFILVAIVGSLVAAVSVAIKQGWFERKIQYTTLFENADGIHPGTVVQMAGLRAGSVEDVELQSNNKIKVNFYVHGKFQSRIKKDSQAQLIRPFIIGDRVLEVTVGSEEVQMLPEHSQLASAETMDIMTLMSGKTLGSYLSKVSGLLENVHELLVAFSNKERTKSVVKMFDKIDPLLGNLDQMSKEVTQLGREVNKILPGLNKQNNRVGEDLAAMVKNLNQLTHDLKAIGPAMQAIGDDMPDVALRAVEALNEATIVMKAMQKSMFIRGNIQDVREEEAKRSRRTPAANKNQSSSP